MTVMQGNLKLREDADYEKIKKSILTYSFSFPFFIWRSGKTNYLIDGTGRHDCLLKMQEEGYLIPELPVVYIQCKNKTEAKQKLLRLNSQYGKMTKESVLEFAEDIDLNFDEIALPDSVIDFSENGEVAETEKKDMDFNESYSVVVQCINEEECEEVFNTLTSQGYKCKVSTL